MMASDLETDPSIVPDLISQAKKKPAAIVTASRWASRGGFAGYGAHRVAANWVFQHLTSALYRTKLTDATFGYRLFPTALVQQIFNGLLHEDGLVKHHSRNQLPGNVRQFGDSILDSANHRDRVGIASLFEDGQVYRALSVHPHHVVLNLLRAFGLPDIPYRDRRLADGLDR